MIEKLYRYVLPGILLLLITACGGKNADSQKRVLMVSIEPQRYLLEKIAGDGWTVKSLLPNGSDPEVFDPSISAMRDAVDSKAYFAISNLAFEEALLPKLIEGDESMIIVDSSEGIDLIHSGHGGADSHDGEHHDCGHHDAGECGHDHETDPHVWASVANSRIIATNMLKAMIDIDPTNKDVYTTNYNSLMQHLNDVDAEIKESLSRVDEGTSLLVWHPSLSYFSRDYGLTQTSVAAENKDLSAKDMRNKLDRVTAGSAAVLVVDAAFDSRRAEDVAKQTGLHPMVVNLTGYDTLGELAKVAHAIGESTR